MKKFDVVKLEINKLELKENDYLVMKLTDPDMKNGLELSDFMKRNFPELANRVLIIVGDVEIYVAKLKNEVMK